MIGVQAEVKLISTNVYQTRFKNNLKIKKKYRITNNRDGTFLF